MNNDSNNLNQNYYNEQNNNSASNYQQIDNENLQTQQPIPQQPIPQQPIPQQPIPQQSVQNNGTKQNNKKTKKNWTITFAIILAIIIILGIFVIPTLFNKDKTIKNSTEKNENVIIVTDNANKNALFNKEGKQLTDFYDKIYNFYSDVAIVKNNEEYAVINSKGKFIINFKKYNYISNAGFLIKAENDDYNYILINNKGKEIEKITDEKILEYFGFNKLIILESEKYYKILNAYTGSLIKKIEKNNSDDLKVYDGDADLTYIYYNNKTYIINYKTGKIINELTGEKQLNSVNNLIVSQYVIREKNKNIYEYYNNDKLMFTTKDCTNLFFEHDNNNLICATDYSNRYLIDSNGKKTLEIYNTNVAYLDSKNYAISENNLTTFYVNGKKIKEIKDTKGALTISRANKIYELKVRTKYDYKYQFYNFKGELITDKYFTNALHFDKTNLAIVSNNQKDFYLIDTKGNKTSKDYDNISYSDPLYMAKKDNIYYILDPSGNEIINTNASIYDIKIYDNFFTISENSKLTYYTQNGKAFYSVNY